MTGLLSLTIFSPLVGVAALLLLRLVSKDEAKTNEAARWITLLTTLFTLTLSVFLVARFDPHQTGFQFVENINWFGGWRYQMGVDGISVLFVLLTAFLLPLCVIASWKSIDKRVLEYMIAFLVLEALVIGVFCALDIIVFYVFFEGQLVPMFLIIGVWGGKNRVYAAYKFFLYTLLGSVLMLAAILAMVGVAHTTSIATLLTYHFDPKLQIWLWLAFFASFAVKMPMWPVHTWLPDAHVEAPTAGSVILAGILLKMGGYGFLRFSLPMFPSASHYFTPLVFALSVIAVVYTSLVAFRQTDIKKLIAYSSVAHMGFVTMGIFSGNVQGEQGAIFQMLSHGVISGALFLCVGVVYDRMHTREIAFYGGLAHADLCGGVPAVHHGQCRLARHVGLCRRDTDHDRRLSGLDLDRDRRRHRGHPVGDLRLDPLSPRDVRRDHQPAAGGDRRSRLAGNPDLHAADHRRPGAGDRAGPGVRHHRRLGQPPGRRLQADRRVRAV